MLNPLNLWCAISHFYTPSCSTEWWPMGSLLWIFVIVISSNDLNTEESGRHIYFTNFQVLSFCLYKFRYEDLIFQWSTSTNVSMNPSCPPGYSTWEAIDILLASDDEGDYNELYPKSKLSSVSEDRTTTTELHADVAVHLDQPESPVVLVIFIIQLINLLLMTSPVLWSISVLDGTLTVYLLVTDAIVFLRMIRLIWAYTFSYWSQPWVNPSGFPEFVSR